MPPSRRALLVLLLAGCDDDLGDGWVLYRVGVGDHVITVFRRS